MPFIPRGIFLLVAEGVIEVTSIKKAPRNIGVGMERGTVKWFSDQKGYGFITPDDGGKDLFVHYSNIEGDGFRTIQDGQEVEYEAGEGRKGPEATNVHPV